MIERLVQWVEQYPIVSLEDGLSEDCGTLAGVEKRLSGDSLVVGDDLLCTNPQRFAARSICGRRTAATEGQSDWHADGSVGSVPSGAGLRDGG